MNCLLNRCVASAWDEELFRFNSMDAVPFLVRHIPEK